MSIRGPKAFTVSATILVADGAASAQLACTAIPLGQPSVLRPWSTASALDDDETYVITIEAPLLANSCAIPAPIPIKFAACQSAGFEVEGLIVYLPREPPVTIATLPSSGRDIISIGSDLKQ